MATFVRNIWSAGDAEVDPKAQLLVAVTIWLRTYDRDGGHWLGLAKLLQLLVPFTTELKLGLDVPALPADRIVSSSGDIWRVIGPGKFVYTSDNWAREFDLQGCYNSSIQLSVHTRWLEWAMCNAVLNLDAAGIPWNKDQTGMFNKVSTIGGFEMAEFLKL